MFTFEMWAGTALTQPSCLQLGLAIFAALVAWVVVIGERADLCPRALLFHHQGAELHPDVAHLSPELTPAVTDDPVPGRSMVASYNPVRVRQRNGTERNGTDRRA